MKAQLLGAIALGFAVGFAVGITLESSGALERLDAAIGKRLIPGDLRVMGDPERKDVASQGS